MSEHEREAHKPPGAAPDERKTQRTWPRLASLLCASSSEDRRDFLKSIAVTSVAGLAKENPRPPSNTHTPEGQANVHAPVNYPRVFTGAALKMISFPLGGVGAGSIGLGGRGELRDWEIFNHPDKGNHLDYAFPSIWVQAEGEKAIAHVLEARLVPPYEGQDGLGANNVPGLSRLQGATFTGEFPQAHIEFHDDRLPVQIRLDAGTPFIPLDADASGLPVAALHYKVRNRSRKTVSVSLAFSIENPVKDSRNERSPDPRVNERRRGNGLEGLLMHNPKLAKDDPAFGSFALAALHSGQGKFTGVTGWPAGRWWDSPLLFWDDFSSDGELGPEPPKPSAVGAVCLKQTIAPGASADYSFLLAWHFPNRTPAVCGWTAPKGHEHTVIGNWYTTRFPDAWAALEYAAADLPKLEARTSQFVTTVRESTLPAPLKEAAMSNLSTLVSTTCFRTADGEFHGFEGADDTHGCCFGNCTHVWNYETATAHLFPSLSQSLRRSAFGFSMDERGGMFFRQLLPDGIQRYGFVAADGQMGQIIKVYIDWQLSGDRAFLAEFWPKAKRALEFAWIKGGWDENRSGILNGVQHNTYDVEFYGPNPLCSIYYLGALRASEEMANASGDIQSAQEYRRVFENGRRWLDTQLFNGEYYFQRIEARKPESIAPGLRGNMGADDPEHPQYQVGDGCLVDQLLGQYLADLCGLGDLVDPAHTRRALDSIYRYNRKATLYDHDTVQRTYVLNDEAAIVVCDYAKGQRPTIPFPYYAEAWTGLEYSVAALMLLRGSPEKAIECISDVRKRYDGVRRNPYDEPECGHHYARAMAAWSSILAASGFRYRGSDQTVSLRPVLNNGTGKFQCFWSAGTGWGTFRVSSAGVQLDVIEGSLQVRHFEIPASLLRTSLTVKSGTSEVKHAVRRDLIELSETVQVKPGTNIQIAAVTGK